MLPTGAISAGVAAGVRLWFASDVEFDHAAAADALAPLRRARTALDDLAESRVRANRVASADWRGVRRDEFDDEFARTQTAIVAGISRIDSTIRQIGAAMDDAEADQARRLRLRAEHALDQARERLRL